MLLIDISKEISVKAIRNLLNITEANINPSIPTANFKWNKNIPIKANARLPTRLNLVARGIDIDSSRCPNCDSDLESEEHLFITCPVAIGVWKGIIKWCPFKKLST